MSNDDIIKKLKEKFSERANAKMVVDLEDFNAYDYSGGNFDDAFNLGMEDGYTQAAWEAMQILNDNDPST